MAGTAMAGDVAQENARNTQWRLKNRANGRAIYDRMIQALRDARTLSFKGDYRWGSHSHCPWPGCTAMTYQAWLKKPNYFRIEAKGSDTPTSGGTIIGDGQKMWIFWNGERPRMAHETDEEYRQTSTNVFMCKPALPGGYSITHETAWLGARHELTVLDLSVFHGCTDTLQPAMDWVEQIAVERWGEEYWDQIRVSLMDEVRIWDLQVSRKSHLPRWIRQSVHDNDSMSSSEWWSDVKVNEEIPDALFKWTPPAGWKEWHEPSNEKRRLPLGLAAPDFECPALDGGKIKLSDYKGKVVWLCFWSINSPPCREEIPELQKLYEKFKAKGLVVIGFNCFDFPNLATQFLNKHGVTFPNVLAPYHSTAELKVMRELYRVEEMPMNYIIDREGNLADARFGYNTKDKDAPYRILKWMGIE